MILIDFIIFVLILFSAFLGIFRGFLKDFTSTVFWLFFVYFFINYVYFSSFYADVFLKYENYLVILIATIFFTIKILLNFIFNKMIKKFKLLYINIILGGIFGLFRGIILVVFLLFYINKYSNTIYLNLLKESCLIHLFFSIVLNNNFEYFINFFKY